MKIHSVHTEQKLLLTALENQDHKVRNLILAETRVDDFGTDVGKEIRRRFDILRQHAKPLAPADDFAEDPSLTKAAADFIRATPKKRRITSRYSLQQAESLVNMLQQYRKSRVLIQGIQAVAAMGKGDISEDKLSAAQRRLEAILQDIRDDKYKSAYNIGRNSTKQEARDLIMQHTTPTNDQFVTTGLSGLDAQIFGFARGDLVVISAQRGGGKTALALQMAINQYLACHNVGFVSLEMTKEQLQQRILSSVTSIPISTIRTKANITPALQKRMYRDWLKFIGHGKGKNALGKECSLIPWIVEDPNYTPYDIELDLGPFGYDCIFIDYLTLFHTNKDLWAAQKEYSRYLKILAKRLNCVIVLLTQLNDEDRVKYGRGPEEDADWWLWWRWDENAKDTGDVEIRLDKARHGKPCRIPARFKLAVMQIDTGGVAGISMSQYGKKKDSWEAGEI